jgi:hypothetical protein
MIAFPALAFAALVLLGFARQPLLRWLGRVLTIGVATGFTAVAMGLYRLGDDRGWTGDGPGMLVVMLLIPVAGAVALATWGAVVAQWVAGPRRVSGSLALAMLAAGMVGTGWQAREHQRQAKPSHDAPVVAVAFADDGARLLSLDAAGTLKTWDVAQRRLLGERREPLLAGARALIATSDGVFAIALGPRGADVLRPGEAGLAPTTLLGVSSATLLPGGRLAWATDQRLHIGALGSLDLQDAGVALGAPITALAADREGALAAALADGRLVVIGPGGETRRELGTLPAPATRLAFSPGGAWLAAADAEARAHVADLRRGEMRALDRWIGLHHAAFVADEVLVFTAAAEDPAALSLSLAASAPATGPWLNHGQIVTALGAAPGAPVAAVAFGPQLFLARAPRRGGDYVSDAERLAHPR